MLQETSVKEFDPFESASNPVQRSFDLWGMVELSAWACALVKGSGKVPFDPTNPDHKRFTAVDVFIQPLVEIDVKYPKTCEEHWIAEFPEWAKITMPSIKALGIDNVREINGKWARVARVPSGRKYEKKDRQTGQPTGEMAEETTFKFIKLFADEAACRADYIAVNGEPAPKFNGNGHNIPTTDPIPSPADAERTTAYAFLKVIVSNAVKGVDNWQTAIEAVTKALAQYPTVAKYYTADSIETTQLITEINPKLLPF